MVAAVFLKNLFPNYLVLKAPPLKGGVGTTWGTIGLYRDNGKENGDCRLGFRVLQGLLSTA